MFVSSSAEFLVKCRCMNSNQGAGDTGPEYLHSEMQLGGSPPSTLPQGTVAEERTVGW